MGREKEEGASMRWRRCRSSAARRPARDMYIRLTVVGAALGLGHAAAAAWRSDLLQCGWAAAWRPSVAPRSSASSSSLLRNTRPVQIRGGMISSAIAPARCCCDRDAVRRRALLAEQPNTGQGGDVVEEYFDVFLSHNWGDDEQGRDNHQRVMAINDHLRSAGLRTWVDQDRMPHEDGSMLQKISAGLDKSKVVIVFITKKYYEKVNSGAADDFCRLEFEYAYRNRGENIVVCLLDREMQDSKAWRGSIGLALGGMFYVDLSSDKWSSAQLDRLVDAVRVKLMSEPAPLPMVPVDLAGTSLPTVASTAVDVEAVEVTDFYKNASEKVKAKMPPQPSNPREAALWLLAALGLVFYYLVQLVVSSGAVMLSALEFGSSELFTQFLTFLGNLW